MRPSEWKVAKVIPLCFPSKSLNETIAVTYFTDHIRKEADSGKAKGAVFIDLSKAFDAGLYYNQSFRFIKKTIPL